MSKFTNTPWRAGITSHRYVLGADNRLIATPNKKDTDELRAERAHLIAAAPDMYEALEDIIEQAEKTNLLIGADLADSIRVFGKIALKKARGEK